jgi:hypothetical protein
MAKRMSVKDFRSVRALLPDEVFALIGGPRAAPTDPVSEDVWNSIMHLPDDVALTTSNHHGRQLGALHMLWEDWIGAYGDEHDEPLFGASWTRPIAFSRARSMRFTAITARRCPTCEARSNLSRSARLETLHRQTTHISAGRIVARRSPFPTAASDCGGWPPSQ